MQDGTVEFYPITIRLEIPVDLSHDQVREAFRALGGRDVRIVDRGG